jgi:hypothetical protein
VLYFTELLKKPYNLILNYWQYISARYYTKVQGDRIVKEPGLPSPEETMRQVEKSRGKLQPPKIKIINGY